MFLLVPAHPGCPGQIPQSRETVVCVCVWYSDKNVPIMQIDLECYMTDKDAVTLHTWSHDITAKMTRGSTVK